QSLLDLAALRIRPDTVRIKSAMPGGGVPWFLTIFGRDSLIASYEALPFRPELAEATLEALAELQSSEWDNWRDAEPGKMPHGRRAEPPVATCELQGYLYDARLRTARLLREVWNDEETAIRLEEEAAALKRRFNRDFWVKGSRHYALALDGEKQLVDAMTSNTG